MIVEDFEKEKCIKCPSYLDKDCCEESLTQAHCKIQFLLDKNHKLEEQNKQMIRTLKRVYSEECNSDNCDDCPVLESCVFQELKDTIESITGKKIEEVI